ncbi:MAG: NAD(P)H-dependent oxidoreductase subunit E, partial [Planctomycetota bacterium]
MGSIIHELTLLQEKEGYLRDESLRTLSRKLGVPLHRIESVSTFYTHFRRDEPKPVQVHSCRDLSCMLGGGPSACEKVRKALEGRDDVEIHEVSCIGRCEIAPAGFVNHDFMDLSDTDAVIEAVDRAAKGEHSAPQEVVTAQ